MGVTHSKGGSLSARKKKRDKLKSLNKAKAAQNGAKDQDEANTSITSTASVTTISVCDGSGMNMDGADSPGRVVRGEIISGVSVSVSMSPLSASSSDNSISKSVGLKESTVFSEEMVEVAGNEAGIDVVTVEPHDHDEGCKLCGALPSSRFYSLEVCGHGFCIRCLFAFSETKLADLPEDCCEILCPLESCGCAISVTDLKKALATFGGVKNEDENHSDHDHEHENDHNHIETVEKNDGEASGSSSNSGNSSKSNSSSTLSMLPVQLSRSLELFLSKSSNYVYCPNPQCKFVFERLPPSRSNEIVFDENGKQLSSVALKHRQLNRFRCRACDTNFCAGCKTIPYHLGFTCKEYFMAKAAKHCRFCDVVLPPNTKPHPACLPFNAVLTKKQGRSLSLLALWKKKEKPRKNTKEKGKDKTVGEKDDAVVEEELLKDGIPKEFFICGGNDCKRKMQISCQGFATCGHYCGGVANGSCMCLQPGCPESAQDGDEFCGICWVEALKSGPTVKLTCGHYFHYDCVLQKLRNKWPGPSISFAFAACPLCQAPIQHPTFAYLTDAIQILYEEVKKKAVERLGVEGMLEDPQITTEGSKYYHKPEEYAMHIFSFYKCHLCEHAYFGGRRQCELEAENVDMSKHNPAELICGGCSTIHAECAVHGKEYIDFKCRFCCSLATYFCGGKAHFCTPCHDKAGQLVEFLNWTTIAKCPPCKGKDECPLGAHHPENGEEYSMGCSMCRAEEGK